MGEIQDEAETGPFRRCIVTRRRLPKEQMIRFVLAPDRKLVPDLAARLPGRGMWLSTSVVNAAGDMIETPSAREDRTRVLARAFARASRGPVGVPSDLPAVLEAALVRRISETLGLARRAGQAVAGFEKAREWISSGRARLVVQASDGSEAERMRFLSGAPPRMPALSPMTGAELGKMFGRDHVVHVAISRGKLAETLFVDAERLAGLRRTEQNTALVNDEADANG
ncbi:MAG: RNA-binding protein [Acetobacteraceae bacterium]|nr:RNA-binding protein [Acetobacteraceae bacterium]